MIWDYMGDEIKVMSLMPNLPSDSISHNRTQVNTSSGNGLFFHQAITLINAGLFHQLDLGTNFGDIWIKINIFVEEKLIWVWCLQNGHHFAGNLFKCTCCHDMRLHGKRHQGQMVLMPKPCCFFFTHWALTQTAHHFADGTFKHFAKHQG